MGGALLQSKTDQNINLINHCIYLKFQNILEEFKIILLFRISYFYVLKFQISFGLRRSITSRSITEDLDIKLPTCTIQWSAKGFLVYIFN